LVEVLIEQGANLDIRNKKNETPEDLAPLEFKELIRNARQNKNQWQKS